MTQTNFFSSINTSSRAIVASAQKKGLPFIDFDSLQSQLAPRKPATPTEVSIKLPTEARTSRTTLDSVYTPLPKKKTVAFSEENEIFGSPKNQPNGSEQDAEKKPSSRIQKGILIKRKKYNDAGTPLNDIKAIEEVRNFNQEEKGTENREQIYSEKTEIEEIRSPLIFLGNDNLKNSQRRRNFPGLEGMKKSATVELIETTQEEPYLKTENFAQSFRRKLEMPKEDFSSKKTLATLFSPKQGNLELSSPLFRVSSHKDIFPSLGLNTPKESFMNNNNNKDINKSNVFVNNASKIMFNVSDSYNLPPTSRGSSPRVFGKGVYALFNRRQPMELDQLENLALQKKNSEEKFPTIESPYANFKKRHVKSNSAFQDSRGNFAFSTGNVIMKSESQVFPKKPSIKPFNPMVPKLDIFAGYAGRSMPNSYQNTPRKFSGETLMSNRTISNNV